MRRLTPAVAALFFGTGLLCAQQIPGTPSALRVVANPGAAPSNASGPRIKFAAPVYDFGRARAGDSVKHDYTFTNVGDQVLEITAVNPGCGCTTIGDWTKKVEPGQTGIVPIQFNSAGYPAGPVQKHPTVVCNDKTAPTVPLQLVGTLWKPIDVNPAYAILNVSPDAQSASTTVHITNNMEDFITISALQSNNRQFQAELKTNQPGKDFLVTISAVQPLSPGTLQSQITFKTSSTNMPVGTIACIAIVQPAVIISPPQINLPQAPLANAVTNSVSIQNHSTNLLRLAEPAINAKDVDIRVQEMQPGRLFNVLVSFPQGFETQGQPVVLTFKSNQPQTPVVRIPVVQAPRQVAPQLATQPGVPNSAAYRKEMQSKLAVAEAGRALLEKELQRLTAEKAELQGRFTNLAIVEAQISRLKGKPAAARQAPDAGLDQRGAQKLVQGVGFQPDQAKDAKPDVATLPAQQLANPLRSRPPEKYPFPVATPPAQQPANPQTAMPVALSSPIPAAQVMDVQKRLAAAEGDKARLEKECRNVLTGKMELEKQFNSLATLETQAARLKGEIAAARRVEWVRQNGSSAADQKGGQRLVEALSGSQAEVKVSTPPGPKVPGPQSANGRAQ